MKKDLGITKLVREAIVTHPSNKYTAEQIFMTLKTGYPELITLARVQRAITGLSKSRHQRHLARDTGERTGERNHAFVWERTETHAKDWGINEHPEAPERISRKIPVRKPSRAVDRQGPGQPPTDQDVMSPYELGEAIIAYIGELKQKAMVLAEEISSLQETINQKDEIIQRLNCGKPMDNKKQAPSGFRMAELARFRK